MIETQWLRRARCKPWVVASAALIFLFLANTLPAVAGEKFRLSIYIGRERDFCPEGFLSKCPKLSGERVDELKRSRKIRLLRNLGAVSPEAGKNRSIALAASAEMVSLARQYRSAGGDGIANRPAILFVAERLDEPPDEGQAVFVAHSIGKKVKSARQKPSKPNVRRSFDYGSLSSLDPDEDHEWTFFTGPEKFFVRFE